jgi:hypothetical protein
MPERIVTLVNARFFVDRFAMACGTRNSSKIFVKNARNACLAGIT